MKKKIIAAALSTAMLATVAISGTLAYFTDSDKDVNVMTAGNVKIIQDEWQRTEDGNDYEEFVNNKPLFPYTGTTDDKGIATGGYTTKLVYPHGLDDATEKDDNHWGDEKKVSSNNDAFANKDNAVDKIITVTNTGNLPAYVRTLLAFEVQVDENGNVVEVPSADGVDRLNYVMYGKAAGLNQFNNEIIIEVNGVKFVVWEYYYTFDKVDGKESALAPKTTSFPSLYQIYLNSKEDNDWYDDYGANYNIIALSQAAQMTGFDSAKEALDTAFGKLEATPEAIAMIQDWFDETGTDDKVVVDVKTEHGETDKDGNKSNTTDVQPVNDAAENNDTTTPATPTT